MGIKKYQIIYADPPWKMRYAIGLKDGFHVRDMPYPQMTVEAIKQLPIKEICDENAILFLWCIDAYIPNIKEIMESWGFKYITVGFVWNKISATGGVNAIVSQYTRKSCEMCYIGRKGKMLVIKPCGTDQYIGEQKRKHSQKPDDIKNRIVKLCGDLPRIELFARQKTEGWDVWGNEVESDIDLTPRKEN